MGLGQVKRLEVTSYALSVLSFSHPHRLKGIHEGGCSYPSIEKAGSSGLSSVFPHLPYLVKKVPSPASLRVPQGKIKRLLISSPLSSSTGRVQGRIPANRLPATPLAIPGQFCLQSAPVLCSNHPIKGRHSCFLCIAISDYL